jgi:predicted DNA-binding transcriptional regulator AlpA
MIKQYHNTSPALITRPQLAARWQCSEMTVYRREREGLLKPIRTGRIVRFSIADIERIEAGLKG